MFYLLLASTIWGLSFGLIGNRLAGLDSSAVALVRLALSALLFLPFAFRSPRLPWRLKFKLLLVGVFQFGLMYLFYISSFKFLPSHVVALFTIFTPIFVALLTYDGHRKRLTRSLAAALLAVAGAAILNHKPVDGSRVWLGFLLVQASNLCFAAGQVLYRRITRRVTRLNDGQASAWMYVGATASCLPMAAHGLSTFAPTTTQWLVLVYLGLVASGVGFWLWNMGVRTARTAGTLAVMNNAKIPMAVLCSLLLFGERANALHLSLAVLLMAAALLICEYTPRRTS